MLFSDDVFEERFDFDYYYYINDIFLLFSISTFDSIDSRSNNNSVHYHENSTLSHFQEDIVEK